MPTNKEILEAAEAVVSEVPQKPAVVENINPAELCETYGKIKGPLKVLLPVIAMIPVYGAAVAAGLTVLMGIADQLCAGVHQ